MKFIHIDENGKNADERKNKDEDKDYILKSELNTKIESLMIINCNFSSTITSKFNDSFFNSFIKNCYKVKFLMKNLQSKKKNEEKILKIRFSEIMESIQRLYLLKKMIYFTSNKELEKLVQIRKKINEKEYKLCHLEVSVNKICNLSITNKELNIESDSFNTTNNITNEFSGFEEMGIGINNELSLKINGYNIPHYKKIEKGGEDAYFYNENTLIIADGVGSWSTKGIDPSLYPKELVKCVFEEINDIEIIDYEEKIKFHLQNAISRANKIKGSSTLTLLKFNNISRKLISCHIGDSSYLIARARKNGFEMIHLSKDQYHNFNFPYQVGRKLDSIDQFIFDEHDLINKDVIICATDGLWDNLSIKVILQTLNQIRDKKSNIVDTKKLAEVLSKKAQIMSFNK